jgi:N-ethylmaleimide reductase
MSNGRNDKYGGSIENRCRFLLEVAEGAVAAIGGDRIGIRVSPYGVASDMPHYPEIDATYTHLAQQLRRTGVLYIHIVDHSGMGGPVVPAAIKNTIRNEFQRTIILSGGFTMDSAAAAVRNGQADLVAFGRPFINNPDLVDRFAHGWALTHELDMATFYSPGEKGYVDYPAHTADSQ